LPQNYPVLANSVSLEPLGASAPSSGSNAGAIAGGVVGGIVAVILLVVLVVVVHRRRDPSAIKPSKVTPPPIFPAPPICPPSPRGVQLSAAAAGTVADDAC